ncbi:hypothetical protein VFPBJ_10295 [Purpureocillium lilacinum]|uniref:Uncharacterized protein n=1 Tax=Purpureocillium lilacinum TaxID=33203 RepID=A0A179GC63_PURLI|nr:hypothetical protein VFPBJ_10295 [Purpureocillium lilacinum]
MASIALQPVQPAMASIALQPVQPVMASIALQPAQPGSPRWLQLPAAARQPAMPSVAAAGYVRRPLEWHCSTPAGLFLALVTGALSGCTGLGSGVV